MYIVRTGTGALAKEIQCISVSETNPNLVDALIEISYFIPKLRTDELICNVEPMIWDFNAISNFLSFLQPQTNETCGNVDST